MGYRSLNPRSTPAPTAARPLLGISKMVIKAHGNSDARAIQNAIRQAKECIENGVIEAIADNLSQLKSRQRSRKKRITTVNQGNLQGDLGRAIAGENQTPMRVFMKRWAFFEK